jgi:hypothetical protein
MDVTLLYLIPAPPHLRLRRERNGPHSPVRFCGRELGTPTEFCMITRTFFFDVFIMFVVSLTFARNRHPRPAWNNTSIANNSTGSLDRSLKPKSDRYNVLFVQDPPSIN